MTATEHPTRRSRPTRILAAGAAVLVGTTAVAFAGAPSASAATPYAQSVGRFLDGEAGGNAIQTLADLKDARASAPGTTSQQNPLRAKLLNKATIPLGHHLQLPGGGVFHL